MVEYHIGSKGAEVIHPAGYLNRAARRRMKKLSMRNYHRVLPLKTKENDNENKESVDSVAN